MDGCGKADLVTDVPTNQRMGVYRGWGPALVWGCEFAVHESSADCAPAEAMRLARDLDGDGRVDVVTACVDSEPRFAVHWQRAPTPPGVDPASANELPTLVPDGPGFVLHGRGFTALSAATLGGVALELEEQHGAPDTIEVFDDGELRLTPAPGTSLTPVALDLQSPFGGTALPLGVVPPAAPVLNELDADGVIGYGGTHDLYVGGEPGDRVFVAASPDLQPTLVPGILSAAIGAQGTSIVAVVEVPVGALGWSALPIPVPALFPVPLHFQGAALDPVTLALPLATSNVVTPTVL